MVLRIIAPKASCSAFHFASCSLVAGVASVKIASTIQNTNWITNAPIVK